jgi:fatty-acid peroxygenase
VPQGGGNVATGHRCPGEGVTLTMIVSVVRALAGTPLTLPPQDLGYDLGRVPTLSTVHDR